MNFFNIADLEKRNIPVAKKGVRILLKRDHEKKENSDIEDDIDEDVDQEKREPEKHFVLKDYRNQPTNHINRKLLLERLNMPTLLQESIIEKTVPSKSPVVQKDSHKDIIVVEPSIYEEEPKEDVEKEKAESKEEDVDKEEPKVKRPRKKREHINIPDQPKVDLITATLNGKPLLKRLPKPSKFKVAISPYYMNNRKIFIDKLAKMFKPYQQKIEARATEISCKTARNEDIDFELLTHQLIVRDYLNTYTPYRGLLLYHGLGSGKTCTSIGIAEGMKTNKEIILMTPASLKVNFFSELKKCGDILYKKNQYWEFISIEGESQNIAILSQVLSLPQQYIREHGGAWLVNITKKSNFKTLSDNDQKNIDEQLDTMIRAKYKDYNYNGLRDSHLNKMSENGKINPFDHKVVIIDEVHNLVSRIANSMNDPKSISQRLYRYLLTATDCKIVFLTGTPIINQPSEIGILFNMLRGGIKTWKFTIQSEKKVTKQIIMEVLKENRFSLYDYLEYSGDILTITRNPFGFVSTYMKERVIKDKRGINGGIGSQKKNKKVTKKHLAKKNKRTKKQREPEKGEFEEKAGIIKQTLYDNPSETLVNDMVEDVKKTDYYSGGSPFEEYRGVQYDENGNIDDEKFERRLISILSDNGYKATPLLENGKGKGKKKEVKVETCLPDDPKVFNENFINNNTGEIDNVDLFKRRILGLTSYFRSAQEELLPSFEKAENGSNYHIVPVSMSEYQFSEYQKIRSDERKQEMQQKKKAKKNKDQENADELPSSYRIYSRSACNFCFPEEYPRPKVALESGKDINEDIFNGVTNQMLESRNDYIEGEDRLSVAEDENVVNYQKRIKDALDYLSNSQKIVLDDSNEDGLERYSPKFAKIIENIQNADYKGLHLLYSQFRTLEGIGILKIILEKNGFVEFKLSRSSGDWTIENFDKDPEKPRFVLYTGTETADEKEIIRNIYNSAWEVVPPSLVSVLKRKHENNIYGEIIKLFMITSSGAEGINLRNTRYVHIVEPYWNMVRVDQVVGRARRICSHEDLPEELRTVKVMIYLSRLTEEQIQSDGNIEMKLKDVSKREYEVREPSGKIVKKRLVFTTDEYLFEIAQIKDGINRQILTAVKETAMDCFLYNKNPDEPLICYNYGSVTKNDFGSYPTFDVDKAYKPNLEVAKKTVELVTIELDGVKYKMNTRSHVVYSMDSYERMKAGRGELDAVGKLVSVTEMVDGVKTKIPKIVAL